MAEHRAGMSQPSNGQKCTRPTSRWRMKRSQGIPTCVDFATHRARRIERPISCPRALRSTAAGGDCPYAPLLAYGAVVDEINVDVLVGRPMALEIVMEGGPVEHEPITTQREGKAMVDADQCRWVLGQCLDQPFGDAAPGPVFPRRWWRQNLNRRRIALGQIDTQAGRSVFARPNRRRRCIEQR
jgi:hypothetical protein